MKKIDVLIKIQYYIIVNFLKKLKMQFYGVFEFSSNHHTIPYHSTKTCLICFIWQHRSQATICVIIHNLEAPHNCVSFLKYPIRCFLLVIMLRAMVLFVYLACASITVLHMVFCEVVTHSV